MTSKSSKGGNLSSLGRERTKNLSFRAFVSSRSPVSNPILWQTACKMKKHMNPRCCYKIRELESKQKTYANHATNLCIKIGRIVNDIKVRMANPRFSSSVVELFGKIQILATTIMILKTEKKTTINLNRDANNNKNNLKKYLCRVEIFSSFSSRDHVYNLIVSRVTQLNWIPAVVLHQRFPLSFRNN